MKIQVIIPNPFFTDRGSCIRILGQIDYFLKNKHTVQALSYYSGRELPGIRIKRSMKIASYEADRAGASFSRLFLDFALLLSSIVENIRTRPDVIHGHLHEGAFIGIISSWFRKSFVVLDAEGSLSGELRDRAGIENRFLLKAIQCLEKWIITHVDCIVVSSPIVAKDMVERFAIAPGRINVVPDGADMERFIAAPQNDLRKKLGIPDNKRIVVYAGVLNRFYGTDSLIDAAALVVRDAPDAHFLIIGYPDVERYRNIAARAGVAEHCTFPGRIGYEDIPAYLSLATMAVAPKLKGTEGTLKLSQYMGAGLPVVAFDTVAHREILGEYGIYASDSGDARSLAVALIHGLRSTDLKERGARLKEKVMRDYSLDAINRSLEELFFRGIQGS